MEATIYYQIFREENGNLVKFINEDFEDEFYAIKYLCERGEEYAEYKIVKCVKVRPKF